MHIEVRRDKRKMIKLNFRKICIWTLVSIGIVSAAFVFSALFYNKKSTHIATGSSIEYKGHSIQVTLAETDTAREQGLSGTTTLQPNTGMFFIFQKPGNYGFWMKDMTYSLDIVWIDADFRIVHIEENVTPATYPTVFYPNTSTQYVLEINPFDARRYNFVQGAQLVFKRS